MQKYIAQRAQSALERSIVPGLEEISSQIEMQHNSPEDDGSPSESSEGSPGS